MVRLVQRRVWVIVILLATVGVTVGVLRMARLFPVLLGATPPLTTQPPLDYMFALSPWLTLIHVLPGILFMILGPFQFNAALRAKQPQLHRLAGWTFVTCSAIIGVSALVMSFVMPAIGGVNQATATALFAAYFLFALYQAVRHIRRREVAMHRVWMLRTFSTGLAVATIRPIVGIFYATSAFSGLTPHEFFGAAFWLGFVLHLMATEGWINLTGTGVSGTVSQWDSRTVRQ